MNVVDAPPTTLFGSRCPHTDHVPPPITVIYADRSGKNWFGAVGASLEVIGRKEQDTRMSGMACFSPVFPAGAEPGDLAVAISPAGVPGTVGRRVEGAGI
jgi:hypothetical protein